VCTTHEDDFLAALISSRYIYYYSNPYFILYLRRNYYINTDSLCAKFLGFNIEDPPLTIYYTLRLYSYVYDQSPYQISRV
jgi:hypothetical protein